MDQRISDIEIIKELLKNARITYKDLSKKFNVTETAIRKRIKKLEEKKIIKKYTINVDIKQLGYQKKVLIGIDTTPEKYIDILEKLRDREEIIRLYSTTGDHMLMIEVWFRNDKELFDYTKSLEKMKGITRICPAIIIEEVK